MANKTEKTKISPDLGGCGGERRKDRC